MATTEVIRHGRRKGTTRSTGDVAEETLRPSQVAVVPSREWQRIRGSLRDAQRVAERAKAQHDARLERHLRSKAIVSNWENTIEGQRLKKLQARQLREEREEAERVKVDVEEAKFQAEQRKEAIERAKTLLYYQTDRVKQFHGALLLSEVLRERDKQVEYKKKKEEKVREVDQQYLRMQEEERERGMLADLKAAESRAKERDIVARFQIAQLSESRRKRVQEREEALAEQKKLDKEVEELNATQKMVEQTRVTNKLVYRDQLDAVLAEKQAMEQRRQMQEAREEEGGKMFAQAKKKMIAMRKAKETEIFQAFQLQQTSLCDQLGQQMSQKKSDEDERIAKAVAEQEAKREREAREKEEKFVAQTREIFRHRRQMITDKECNEKEQAQLDQEVLKQRVIQDQKFHSQQLEKRQKAAKESQDLQDFHKTQMAEVHLCQAKEREDEEACTAQNMKLLQVEEDQFQEYARRVIGEAKQRGPHTQPIKKAAQAGAGGGRGPVFHGKGGIRPSYQAMDSTAIELPSYHSKQPRPHPSTQNRMGFTW